MVPSTLIAAIDPLVPPDHTAMISAPADSDGTASDTVSPPPAYDCPPCKFCAAMNPRYTEHVELSAAPRLVEMFTDDGYQMVPMPAGPICKVMVPLAPIFPVTWPPVRGTPWIWRVNRRLSTTWIRCCPVPAAPIRPPVSLSP